MGYIESILMKDENIIAMGKVHWMELIVAIIITGLFWWLIFPFFLLFSSISHRISTELAVTTHRVIAKQGLIQRHATDLTLDRVQNITVDQGIFGRIFNYGSVRVTTAGEHTPIAGIVQPAVFKAAVTNQMETYSQMKMQQQAEAIAKSLKQNQ